LRTIARSLQGHAGELFILSRLFHSVAGKGVNEINVRAARDLMARVNVRVPAWEMKKLMTRFDANGDQKLDFGEFADMIRSLRKHSAITKAFQRLKKNGKVEIAA